MLRFFVLVALVHGFFAEDLQFQVQPAAGGFVIGGEFDGVIVLKIDDDLPVDVVHVSLDDPLGQSELLFAENTLFLYSKPKDEAGSSGVKTIPNLGLLVGVLFWLALRLSGSSSTLGFGGFLFCCVSAVVAETHNCDTPPVSTFSFSSSFINQLTIENPVAEVIFGGGFLDLAGFEVKCGTDTHCLTLMCDYDVKKSGCFVESEKFDLLVGSLFAISSDQHSTTVQMQLGVEKALEYVGFQFPSIRVISTDAGPTPETSLAKVQELYGFGIRVFIGPASSAEAFLILDWASEFAPDCIFLSPSATAPLLRNYPQIFQLSMDDLQLGEALANTIFQIPRYPTIIPLCRNDGYAEGILATVSEHVERHTIREAIKYDQLTPTKSAELINSLETMLESEPEDRPTIILVIAFDEVQLLLEALDTLDPSSRIFSTQWIGAGFSLSNRIVSFASALEMGRKVNLTCLNYFGSETGSLRILRNDLLLEISEATNSLVTPYAATAFDALLLIDSVCRLHRTGDIDILRANLIHESQFIFGISGHLGLSEDTQARQAGESFETVLARSPGPLEEDWQIRSWTFVDLSRRDRVQSANAKAGSFGFGDETFFDCKTANVSFLRPGWRKGSATFPVSRDMTFSVPALDDVRLEFSDCQGSPTIVGYCSSGRAGETVGCSYDFSPTNRRAVGWDLFGWSAACVLTPTYSFYGWKTCTGARVRWETSVCYARWCGPVDHCKQNEFDTADSPPCNNVDACCKLHDKCYDNTQVDNCDCDYHFQTCLEKVNQVGITNWQCPEHPRILRESDSAYLFWARNMGVYLMQGWNCYGKPPPTPSPIPPPPPPPPTPIDEDLVVCCVYSNRDAPSLLDCLRLRRYGEIEPKQCESRISYNLLGQAVVSWEECMLCGSRNF